MEAWKALERRLYAVGDRVFARVRVPLLAMIVATLGSGGLAIYLLPAREYLADPQPLRVELQTDAVVRSVSVTTEGFNETKNMFIEVVADYTAEFIGDPEHKLSMDIEGVEIDKCFGGPPVVV
jgi:hypothetical protein